LKAAQHFIIIGGGLAGTFLAARLGLAGNRVTMVDDEAPEGASRIAAGLFNVITGRFGAKSWKAETLLSELSAFFAIPEFAPANAYVHYLRIYRPFKTIEEYNKWTARVADAEFSKLVEFTARPLMPEKLHNPHGGILVLPCGWVDTGPLLIAMKALLRKSFAMEYFRERLPYDAISPGTKTIRLKERSLRYDHLVFCEGAAGKDNPLFGGLPIIPNKGEILRIQAPGLSLDFALSRKVYLIPAGGDEYIAGATYQNKFVDALPTAEGKAEIVSHLEAAIRLPFEVLAHRAGIRPTTPDRKAILGTHPVDSSVHTFTGLGTKGILQAPWLSRHMADYLLDPGIGIPAEVSLRRFEKKS
jgi:glycine/D-amino acid oxidase-like deaminating enzyme